MSKLNVLPQPASASLTAKLHQIKNQAENMEKSQAMAIHTDAKQAFSAHIAALRQAGVKISPKTEAIYSTFFLLGAQTAVETVVRSKIRQPQVPVIWGICLSSGRPFHTV
jgi:hypothetical protein